MPVYIVESYLFWEIREGGMAQCPLATRAVVSGGVGVLHPPIIWSPSANFWSVGKKGREEGKQEGKEGGREEGKWEEKKKRRTRRKMEGKRNVRKGMEEQDGEWNVIGYFDFRNRCRIGLETRLFCMQWPLSNSSSYQSLFPDSKQTSTRQWHRHGRSDWVCWQI